MASPPGDPSILAADLARLHAEFPGYRIWHETTGDRARLVAVRRYHGTSRRSTHLNREPSIDSGLASKTSR